MAKYRITGPDGGTYEVTAPDTASEAEVLAYAQKSYAQKPLAPLSVDPTEGMSTTDKLLAGAGKAVTDLGRGVGQMMGVVSREDVAQSRKLDAPLMSTKAGLAGNLAGNVALFAPTATIPGANTVAGAGVVGGLMGLVQPSVSSTETMANIALGGVGGAAGQAIANKVPGMLQGRVDKAKALQQGNAQKFDAAQAAAKEGYVIPPADLEPGVVSEALSGLSGKIKTAQVASQRNQQVTNALARKELGIVDDIPVTTELLDSVRAEAGKAYGAISKLGKLDASGVALPKDVAVGKSSNALLAGSRNEVDASEVIRAWKQANHDATGYYRAYARDANPETLAKAKAAANSAKSIDDFLVSALDKLGQKDLVKNLKDARVQIAKTYTVEKALNPQTGDVSAQVLAKDLAKGKALSGGLLTAAKAAQGFPKATQALKEAPKALSPLDYAVAFGTGTATGNPLAAATLAARPLARNALLSSFAQSRALQQGAPAPFSQATQAVLENRVAQMLARPVGITGGLSFGATE